MYKPCLRPIEIIQIQGEKGEPLILIRDQFNFSEKMLICPLNRTLLFLLQMIDGTRTAEDLQKGILLKTGETVFTDLINDFIKQLSDAYLLDDENFHTYMAKSVNDFKSGTIRKSTHIKINTPDDRLKLVSNISNFFTCPEGPGKIGEIKDEESPGAIISPHIDFHRGGPCFAYAYKEIAERKPADIYLILGIAHIGGRNKFIGTLKDFETPFGIVETDKDFMNKINEYYEMDLFEDEFVHKNEHSIEFQAVFLKYLAGLNEHDFKIAPILCSSFHDAVAGNISPAGILEIKSFIEGVQKAIAECGKKVCIISASDLAHVGQRFGDNIKMTPEYLQNLGKEDEEMLKTICEPDAEKFFNLIQQENDKRRVCGFPSIYTTLSILGNKPQGTLLKYDMAIDPANHSCVSFASIAYYTNK